MYKVIQRFFVVYQEYDNKKAKKRLISNTNCLINSSSIEVSLFYNQWYSDEVLLQICESISTRVADKT